MDLININYPSPYIWLLGLLGFYRGINAGIYYYKENYSYTTILYTNTIFYGIFGSILYIQPVMSPYLLYKELYRLEVNIRNLEYLKGTEFYNQLLSGSKYI
jgi:hypothetical protein